VRLAIDDFGTGYSSLSSLRELPVDILKIAQPFVDDLGTDGDDGAFAAAIVRLGQTLGLSMIAEGIIRENRVVLRLTPYATFETPPRHVYSADDVNENLTHEVGTSLPW